MHAAADEQRPPTAVWASVGARLVLVFAALAVAGWLGLGLWSAKLAERAEKDVNQAKGGGKDSVAVRQGFADFRRARAFNDDAEVLIRETTAAVVVRDLPRARALATEAARREPENFDVWTLLYSLQKGPDPAAAADAKRRALAIDPRAGRLFN